MVDNTTGLPLSTPRGPIKPTDRTVQQKHCKERKRKRLKVNRIKCTNVKWMTNDDAMNDREHSRKEMGVWDTAWMYLRCTVLNEEGRVKSLHIKWLHPSTWSSGKDKTTVIETTLLVYRGWPDPSGMHIFWDNGNVHLVSWLHDCVLPLHSTNRIFMED